MTPLWRRRLLSVLAAIAIGAALGYGWQALFGDGASPAGRSFGEARIGGPFTLLDQDGKRRGDAEFRGRLMLVAFGFTSCPDICPLELQLMADAIDRLGADAEAVQPIFVTVDPGRDTPAVLKSYMERFSTHLVGLTGTAEEIAAVARAYRVYTRVNGDPARDANYTVDHTGLIYLMGRDGKFRAHFTHETPPERMAATIRAHL
ncbi:MAG: SCO family protein [Pseudomonadota bacterium]